MKTVFELMIKSLRFRKTTVGLTVFTIAISVFLILSVNRLRIDSKASFQKTISNIDLIVGAKTGSTQLLLSTVFHHGFPSNNISYDFFSSIQKREDVLFAIPISLGDSHRGYRVIGTNEDFFTHFTYGNKQPLRLSSGQWFKQAKDVVVGSNVAQKFGYQTGDPVTIAHGIAEKSFAEHDQIDFAIGGILEPTGTPVDRALYISLEALETIHLEEGEFRQDLTPTSITAFFVGLKNKVALFSIQRMINDYKKEPLLAIIPGLTFYELWNLIAVAEKALLAVSVLVLLAGMVGLLTSILMSMSQRKHEMAILRSQGASPLAIASLFIVESGVLTLLGALTGFALLKIVTWFFHADFAIHFGIYLNQSLSDPIEWALVGAISLFGWIIGLIPSVIAYQKTLHEGLHP